MARILKSDTTEPLAGASPFNLDDIENEAEKIMQSAQARARQLLQQAYVESERLKHAAITAGTEEGRNEGREEGRKLGLEIGRKEGFAAAYKEAETKLAAEAASLLKLLAEMTKTLETKLKSAEKSAKLDLIKLAVRIAECIVKKEVKCDSEILRANVEKAVELVGKKHTITILVNPADLAAAEKLLPALRQTFLEIETVTLEGTPEVAPGGCIVRSESGSVDADLQTQLREIERILTG